MGCETGLVQQQGRNAGWLLSRPCPVARRDGYATAPGHHLSQRGFDQLVSQLGHIERRVAALLQPGLGERSRVARPAEHGASLTRRRSGGNQLRPSAVASAAARYARVSRTPSLILARL